ncbi:Hypothetical protein SMAX5B_000729 [Scophthalmus maximus]|uniref:Uncharacterized protein n=1 Tax=Scophthalmus maximus TaxID=52904 RepID=A0A2U9B6L4_SCOMX|nr:Hypothetical protein SMAX5B_000729 [Scophthalmus maximus]
MLHIGEVTSTRLNGNRVKGTRGTPYSTLRQSGSSAPRLAAHRAQVETLRPAAEAGGAGGGQALQEHRLASMPAWTPPAGHVEFSLWRQTALQPTHRIVAELDFAARLNERCFAS